MSIIYDALKKVEKTNFGYPIPESAAAQNQQKSYPPKPKKIKLLFYSFMVISGLSLGSIVYSFIAQQPARPPKPTLPAVNLKPALVQEPSTPPPKEPPLAQPQQILPPVKPEEITVQKAPEPFALNGVFFSQDQGYALINNHIVKEGDVVGGATVKRINMDEVELVYGGSSIKLSAGK